MSKVLRNQQELQQEDFLKYPGWKLLPYEKCHFRIADDNTFIIKQFEEFNYISYLDRDYNIKRKNYNECIDRKDWFLESILESPNLLKIKFKDSDSLSRDFDEIFFNLFKVIDYEKIHEISFEFIPPVGDYKNIELKCLHQNKYEVKRTIKLIDKKELLAKTVIFEKCDIPMNFYYRKDNIVFSENNNFEICKKFKIIKETLNSPDFFEYYRLSDKNMEDIKEIANLSFLVSSNVSRLKLFDFCLNTIRYNFKELEFDAKIELCKKLDEFWFENMEIFHIFLN